MSVAFHMGIAVAALISMPQLLDIPLHNQIVQYAIDTPNTYAWALFPYRFIHLCSCWLTAGYSQDVQYSLRILVKRLFQHLGPPKLGLPRNNNPYHFLIRVYHMQGL